MAAEKCPLPLEAIEKPSHNHDIDLPLKESLSLAEPCPEGEVTDQNTVDFGENDSENPTQWPVCRKWSIVILVATMFMLTYVHSM